MPEWSVRGGETIGPAPFLIAGIVNITPDSFYDGGLYQDSLVGAEHGCQLWEEGAHVLDLGGESTRPFSQPIDSETELGRVLPVQEKILETYPDARISIDTYKAEVADQCLQAGAVAINDISACRFDPPLLDVLLQYQPGYVLMHTLDHPENMQKNPRYRDVISELMSFFEERLAYLVRAGLPEENIVLDPGIGFGKTLEHNLEILRNINQFHRLGRPLFMGLSYKSLWGKLLDLELQDRGLPTQVATALMASRNVGIHRVHDVRATRDTLRIVESLS